MIWVYSGDSTEPKRCGGSFQYACVTARRNKFINVTNYFPVKEQTKYYASALSKYLGRTLRLNDIENYKSHIKDTSYFSSDKIYFSYDGFLANNRYPLKKEVFEKDFYREPYKNKKVLWTEKKISIMEKFIRLKK